MCDVGGGASVGRIPGRIPGTRSYCAIRLAVQYFVWGKA